MKIAIDSITTGKRYRKDVGNLQELADSIKEQGLLQPVGLTENRELVFGKRRIEAVKLLGWTEIDARVVNVTSLLEGELTENEVRKQFSLDERVAIGLALEDMLGERRGGDRVSKEIKEQSGTVSTLKEKTRDIAAKKT